MPNPARMGLRRLWMRLHQIIGIGLFVVLAPLAITGALSVVRGDLDSALHPERRPSAPGEARLAPSIYLASARSVFLPDASIAAIRFPQKPGDAVVVTGRGKPPPGAVGPARRGAALTAWLDPATGKVLANRSMVGRGTDFLAQAHTFHETLMLGEGGRQVVGWLGLAMAIQALTGLWLWWPRAAALWLGLRWRRTAQTLANAHYLIGFWTSIPLLALSITGIALAFPETTSAVLTPGAPAVEEGPPRQSPPLTAPGLDPDHVAGLALGPTAGARLSSLTLPTQARPAWIATVARDGHRPVALAIADDTGAVTPALKPARETGSSPLRTLHQLHSGEGAWIVWAWIIVITGLAPLLLGLSGIVVWIERLNKRAALRAA